MDRANIERISAALANETRLLIFEAIAGNTEMNCRAIFSTWLTRIAINSALIILRKKRTSLDIAMVGTDNSGADGLGYEIADRAPTPERRYAQSEEQRILKKAIHSLPRTLREVVEIQQLQERSIRETATAMCISVAAAKGRLFHAKVALRKHRS